MTFNSNESNLCLQLSKCFVSHLKMGFGLRLTDGVYGDKRTPIGNRFEVCLVASSLVSSMAGDIVLALMDPQVVFTLPVGASPR